MITPKVFRYTWAAFGIVLCVGCSRYFSEGSTYAKTGNVMDLFSEPTLDLGPQQSQYVPVFYSVRVKHFDADGHGYYDSIVVASEQLMFVPCWLMNGAWSIVEKPASLVDKWESKDRISRKSAICAYVVMYPFAWMCEKGVDAFWCLGIAIVAVCDPVMHDSPILCIEVPKHVIVGRSERTEDGISCERSTQQ